MTTEPLRPARIAGLALLGVAAVATALGVVTLLGGNGEPSAGQTSITLPAGTTSPTDATSGITGPPSTTPAPATSTTTPSPGGTTSEPTAVPTAPGGPGGSGGSGGTGGPGSPGSPGSPDDRTSYQDVPVRVYNNSTVVGLADRAGEDLEAAGWNVVEVGNHQGRLYETTVYYRPGTDEEAAAKALGAAFKIRVAPRFAGIENASPGLIVIVTKEYADRAQAKR